MHFCARSDAVFLPCFHFSRYTLVCACSCQALAGRQQYSLLTCSRTSLQLPVFPTKHRYTPQCSDNMFIHIPYSSYSYIYSSYIFFIFKGMAIACHFLRNKDPSFEPRRVVVVRGEGALRNGARILRGGPTHTHTHTQHHTQMLYFAYIYIYIYLYRHMRAHSYISV